jgi:hypothetical protein
MSARGRFLLDRRAFLGEPAGGLAAIALASLARADAVVPYRPLIRPGEPASARPALFTPKANRALVIFCSGALSHLDSFDYKPELIRLDGRPMPGASGLVTFQGEQGALTRSPWDFRPRGQSGKMVSDLLPNLASMADEFCFLHGMTAKSNTHGPAENQMSTGFTLDGFPGMGCWVSYALGSPSRDLPAFVAIPDPRGGPQVGSNHWNSAFLPAVFQGVAFNAAKPLPHLAAPAGLNPLADRKSREYLRLLERKALARNPGDSELEARVASYEMAGRMQVAAAEAADLSRESAGTLRMYGADQADPVRAGFARNCILARRLLERGTRFVQLFNGAYAMGEGVGNWDGHKTLVKQYSVHAPILDQPAAALLADLKRTGLLDDTVVALVTEFGRMPTFQKGASGRDHNPAGFTVLLAGAGIRRGHSHGATDPFGHKAVEGVTTIYDLHATLLHLLGIDHERLSVYHNGIERRLTDVHGHVITGALA